MTIINAIAAGSIPGKDRVSYDSVRAYIDELVAEEDMINNLEKQLKEDKITQTGYNTLLEMVNNGRFSKKLSWNTHGELNYGTYYC